MYQVDASILVGVRSFFATVVPFGARGRIPPGGELGAIGFGATLAADGILVLRFGSTLGVVWVGVLEVLRLHILARVRRLAAHADLGELSAFAALADFQEASRLYKKLLWKFALAFSAQGRRLAVKF